MKLCRIGVLGKEKPALIDENCDYKDLSSVITDLNPLNLNLKMIEKIQNINSFKLPKLNKNLRIGEIILKGYLR